MFRTFHKLQWKGEKTSLATTAWIMEDPLAENDPMSTTHTNKPMNNKA